MRQVTDAESSLAVFISCRNVDDSYAFVTLSIHTSVNDPRVGGCETKFMLPALQIHKCKLCPSSGLPPYSFLNVSLLLLYNGKININTTTVFPHLQLSTH